MTNELVVIKKSEIALREENTKQWDILLTVLKPDEEKIIDPSKLSNLLDALEYLVGRSLSYNSCESITLRLENNRRVAVILHKKTGRGREETIVLGIPPNLLPAGENYVAT